MYSFPLWCLRGKIWNLTVLVPDRCLFIYLVTYKNTVLHNDLCFVLIRKTSEKKVRLKDTFSKKDILYPAEVTRSFAGSFENEDQ